jgi:hypothetical protein
MMQDNNDLYPRFESQRQGGPQPGRRRVTGSGASVDMARQTRLTTGATFVLLPYLICP